MKATKLMILGILGVSLILVSVVSAADWSVPGDFATIQEAIDSPYVLSGDRIFVGPGNHYGATVTKAVEIKGLDGAVINDGPSPWDMATRRTGFYFPAAEPGSSWSIFPGFGLGSGATISHLTFETVEFPVFSRGANDVTVQHCKMSNPVQGVTNWHGCRWQVTNNEINDMRTMNGGGIGILFGAWCKVDVTDNVAAHNKINGVLHMGAGELGGYNGTGIALYSDARYGRPGALSVAFNQAIKNKISLVSENVGLADVVAIELTDTRDVPDTSIICGNAIGFNDLRGTILQIVLTPAGLDEVNSISRNLGDNRGHGLHPSAF